MTKTNKKDKKVQKVEEAQDNKTYKIDKSKIELNLELNLSEVEAVLQLLGTVRYDVVAPTIAKINEQAKSQLTEDKIEKAKVEVQEEEKSKGGESKKALDKNLDEAV